MNEQEINQLNRYLYQELENCTKLIRTMKQMKLDYYELTEKEGRLRQSIATSLRKLEELWNNEKETK